MKTILFLSFQKPSGLPPFLALIDTLLQSGQYNIKVVAAEYDDETDDLYRGKNVEFIHFYNRELSKNSLYRKYQILKYEWIVKQNFKKYISSIPHDILWVIHELTAIRVGNLIKEPFILTTYELNDTFPYVLKKLAPISKKAKVNVVCEYNRGQMMKLWFKLKDDPIVLPNKPCVVPSKKNIHTDTIVDQIKEKIVLYQGYMAPSERNLSALCDAVEELKDYRLVLMGRKNDYVKSLLASHPRAVHIDYIKAPRHLNVTSHAHIGIVTYSYHSLNTIYCAPNKIWEYSSFAIPMIGNNIPGLKYTIEQSNSGICVDTDDKNAIKNAILKIDSEYNSYASNARKMYESCDISSIIDSILFQFSK